MIADERFVEIGSATYSAPGGAKLGGHCQTIAAYDAPGDRFGVISTWGRQYGENGIFWVSSSYMDQYAYDMWIVDQGPEMLR
jgi:C1A family cysteine protease